MILGIESSCDESALALFAPDSGLAGEWVHSQMALHSEYGGVVPDLASREHLENFPWLLDAVFEKLGDTGKIDRIAVTRGPGLAGCLALGISVAKSLALALDVPLVGVNHLRGHVFSPFIDLHSASPTNFPDRMEGLLPHLGLVVSGGNTLLFELTSGGRVTIIAETVDDAAGEALDKGAKLLGLGYPGGPLVERKAAGGDPAKYDFPRAFFASNEMRFSFSGLKTSLRYTLEKMDAAQLEAEMPSLCASYQQAVVDALARKIRQALKRGIFKSVGLSGGVANNRLLRATVEQIGNEAALPVFRAEPRHTGDNAAMVAFAAFADPGHAARESECDLGFEPSLRITH